jgi:hypothetical protein
MSPWHAGLIGIGIGILVFGFLCVRAVGGLARRDGMARRADSPPSPPDVMRIVEYHRVADCVYEVTTESARHGLVTQRVVIFPNGSLDPPVSGPVP